MLPTSFVTLSESLDIAVNVRGQGLLALKSMDLGHGTGLGDMSLTSSCPQISHRCLLACGSFGPGNAKALPY